MVGLAAMIFAFFFGMRTERLGLRPLLIVAVVAIGLAYASMAVMKVPVGVAYVYQALFQLVVMGVLFAIGYFVGRRTNRDKLD
ncbi:MAG: hypothetical protein V4460_09665 [Pseudomonadota bacterium]|jgi:uncharacterized membrane-anchored protein